MSTTEEGVIWAHASRVPTERRANASQIPVRLSYGSGAVTKGSLQESWRGVQLPTIVANFPSWRLKTPFLEGVKRTTYSSMRGLRLPP